MLITSNIAEFIGAELDIVLLVAGPRFFGLRCHLHEDYLRSAGDFYTSFLQAAA